MSLKEVGLIKQDLPFVNLYCETQRVLNPDEEHVVTNHTLFKTNSEESVNILVHS